MAKLDATLSPFWLVGCGNMAGAMVEGWRKAGLDLAEATAIRPSGAGVEGVRTIRELPAGPPPGLCLLGFKPQKLDEIAPTLAPRLDGGTVIISILAGVEVESLRRRFPEVRSVCRVLPNLPVSERRGVLPLAGDAEEPLRADLLQLMGMLGLAFWCEAENSLASVGSVAGAGPAYVARFVAALARAGEGRGLEPELAVRIALETVLGTALMADARGEGMAAIAARVASPAGTTEAGLAVLDADGALDRLVDATIAAASRRGAELAAAARGD